MNLRAEAEFRAHGECSGVKRSDPTRRVIDNE